jgi:hypothetical protein
MKFLICLAILLSILCTYDAKPNLRYSDKVNGTQILVGDHVVAIAQKLQNHSRISRNHESYNENDDDDDDGYQGNPDLNNNMEEDKININNNNVAPAQGININNNNLGSYGGVNINNNNG